MRRPRPDAAAREQQREARFTSLGASRFTLVKRRAEPRFAVELDVSLGSDHNFYGGLSENLSVQGVFVATHLLKPVGQLIELSIFLPERPEPVRGIAEVRWVREYNEQSDTPPGMGLRFVELESGSAEAIGRFLTQREVFFYDDEL